jgi:hypothetical protein
MFDLRYHVASLAAVFLALIIGILVGVGIADRGLLDKGTRSLLEHQVADLRARLDAATKQSAATNREQKAAQSYIKETYPILVRNRLRGTHIALVFVGPVDPGMASTLDQALTESGAEKTRLRALKMPLDIPRLDTRLAAQPAGDGYVGRSKLESLGRALGEELMSGGETPLWNALTQALVEETSGASKPPVDGVIVVRTVPPQRDGTSRFLSGFYQGLTSAGLPAVGVETTDSSSSALEAFRLAGLSTVDDVDEPSGRLALVFLLAGAPGGHYGVKRSADDVLPPLSNPLAGGG